MQQHKYNGWGLYRDADDPRLVVPKRNPALGWTINLGHRSARIFLVVMILLVAAAIVVSALLS